MMADKPRHGTTRILTVRDGYKVQQLTSKGWIWLAWYSTTERAHEFAALMAGHPVKQDREVVAMYEPK
jgi:hypothetical protein